jgi:hypothetical protein
MDILDSVRRYFKLKMPGKTKDHHPSAHELLTLWTEFRTEASEISFEFSSHLPSLSESVKVTAVKKIVKICQDMSLFASANIDHTKEVIASMTHLDELEAGPDVAFWDLVSIFSGGNKMRSQIQAKRNSEFKIFFREADKLKKKYDAFELEYFNIAYEAERVFFKTFRGKPIG